jgi:hypothetical protein
MSKILTWLADGIRSLGARLSRPALIDANIGRPSHRRVRPPVRLSRPALIDANIGRPGLPDDVKVVSTDDVKVVLTEAEWLECTDMGRMLLFIWNRISTRKLRLFACALCRIQSTVLSEKRFLTPVEIGERYADGVVSQEERQAAWKAINLFREEVVAEGDLEKAAAGRDAARCLEVSKNRIVGLQYLLEDWLSRGVHGAPCWEHSEACQVLRDILGNPFQSVSADLAWLTWNGGTVVKVAEAIYAERAFDRLPILADALEDAGCTDRAILDHLRGPGPHTRGCFALDLVLEKS